MRAQALPASAGWQWLMGAFALYRRNPALLSMLVVSYWLCLMLLNVVPILGTLAASMLAPGLSLGLMQACRLLESGERFGPMVLFGSLKENTRSMVALGGLYLCCTLGILGISALVDGGEFLRFMLSAKTPEAEGAEAMAEGDVLTSSLVVMTLLTPVLMAYWFAPVLAGWHRCTAPKALFFSFVACWMNWRPFLVYSLGLLLLAAVLPGLLYGVLLFLLPSQHLASTLLLTVMVLAVAPIVVASFYTSYRDVFGFSTSA